MAARYSEDDGAGASARRPILVVEDDADARNILTLALEYEGYAVESADDGLSALQKLRSMRPQLIILDLNMPRMGGEEFLYAWRAGVQTAGVPVIIVTAASAALKPSDLGVEAFIPKPFDLDMLLWHVNDLLTLSHRASVSTSVNTPASEMAEVTERLATVMSSVLISAEQICAAPNLPDDLRNVATMGLDAAQRASVLVRRLNHIIVPQD